MKLIKGTFINNTLMVLLVSSLCWSRIAARNDNVLLTSSNADKVLSRGFVDLDVSVADMMFVSPESHVSVGNTFKQN